MAEFEAALGPLSAPRTGPDGEPDPRSWGTRRAHALMELVHRAVSTDTSIIGRGSTHATLIVTAADLAEGVGTARTAGTIDLGRFLSIPTARAMTCHASLTPVVVDAHGNPILIGRTQRLFTPAQTQALLVRDIGCTLPGCTRPGDWTDAHHHIHWADGGPSDLDNAALLCQMHHTLVHTRRLAGHLSAGPPGTPDEHRYRVTRDLTPTSYDHHLATTAPTPPLTPASRGGRCGRNQRDRLHRGTHIEPREAGGIPEIDVRVHAGATERLRDADSSQR